MVFPSPYIHTPSLTYHTHTHTSCFHPPNSYTRRAFAEVLQEDDGLGASHIQGPTGRAHLAPSSSSLGAASLAQYAEMGALAGAGGGEEQEEGEDEEIELDFDVDVVVGQDGGGERDSAAVIA